MFCVLGRDLYGGVGTLSRFCSIRVCFLVPPREMVAGREPQIMKFMKNIGFTNVVEGWSRITVAKPTFSKKSHGFQTMWLRGRNSWITLVLPMFLKDGAE